MISVELLVIAVALGCDAFSVALGVGSQGLSGRRIFRLTWHFGLFQFLMPLLGLALGAMTAQTAGTAGSWVAAAALAVIGFRMARGALGPRDCGRPRRDPTRGWSLVMLSFSTSVDALVAGFSLGLLGVNLLLACAIIGLTAGLMTLAGMVLGAGAARGLGRWAEFAGGVVLMGLAVAFVVS
ncbi:MAG: manganese efflux pump [Candidatus Zixiibacteriota bacterium]|nr:MAG: manganese efflux pump [candidate division Zixibacteria bacterium]